MEYFYAIIQGMSGETIAENGIITMNSLDLYVTGKVCELTNSAQEPILVSLDGYFPVARLR
jgi:hypothetical protein